MKLLPLTVLLLATLAPAPAHGSFLGIGEKKPAISASKGPPIPAPLRLQISERTPTRFRLQVVGTPDEPVTFLIRKNAQFGSVRLLSKVPGSSAEAEYLPAEDAAAEADSFTFAVQNSRGISAEETVQIRILEPGGKLDAPAELSFGKLSVGKSAEMALKIGNSGPGFLRGSAEAPGPWTIDPRESVFEIPPHSFHTMLLRLTPMVPGKLSGELQIRGTATGTVRLLAEAEDWILVEKEPVVLTQSGGGKASGSLQIWSPSEDGDKIQIQSPLQHPEEALLKGGEKISIPLSATAAPPTGQSGSMQLRASDGRTRLVKWKVLPLGPVLRGFEKWEGTIRIAPDSPSKSATVTFRNEGGLPGTWNFACPEPYTLVFSQAPLIPRGTSGVTFAPGESIQTTVSFKGSAKTLKEGTLSVTGPGGPISFKISTKASKPQAAVEPPTPSPSPSLPVEPPPLTPLPAPALAVAPLDLIHPATTATPSKAPQAATVKKNDASPSEAVDRINRAFLSGTALKGVVLRDVTPTSAKLVFPIPPQIQAKDLLLLERLLSNEGGEMKIQWVPMTRARASRNPEGAMVYSITGLKPNSCTTICLVGPVNPDGTRNGLHQCDIVTPASESWFTASKAALLVGAAWAGWVLLRRNARKP